MITLTDEQVLADLAAVIAGREDYVYTEENGPNCAYFDGNQPSCIVGHVLARHGVTLADIQDDVADHNGDTVHTLAADGLLICSQAAEVALSMAQMMQDTGHTWGEAFAAAEETMLEMAEVDYQDEDEDED